MSAPLEAEVVLPCRDPNGTSAWLVEELGFRVERVWPADDPREVVVSGRGVRIALVRDPEATPGRLRLRVAAVEGQPTLEAPDGTRVERVLADPPLVVPPLQPQPTITRGGPWVEGRASMRYRDLIPDRQGGRFVASRIRIDEGGPVPDYVHFHRVVFQMIFCARGWVRVAYQDQGEPLVMEPGDCVLQPPGIRHRVLECSDGLEVIEVGCPAAHPTVADHELTLPGSARADRLYGGQRFVHHRAKAASWAASGYPGFEARDTGIGEATRRLADVRVLRPTGDAFEPRRATHDDELHLLVPLAGEVELGLDGVAPLGEGDAAVIVAGEPHHLVGSEDLRLLEVSVHRASMSEVSA